MRKLIESTFVSLDGIIDDTRPSTASRAEPQNWGQPYWDDDHGNYSGKLMASADAMLLGRVTYEGFAEAWSARGGAFAATFHPLGRRAVASLARGRAEGAGEGVCQAKRLARPVRRMGPRAGRGIAGRRGVRQDGRP